MLKSTGCDYFQFNIQMGVPEVQLVGLLENHFLQQEGPICKKEIKIICFLKRKLAKGILYAGLYQYLLAH